MTSAGCHSNTMGLGWIFITTVIVFVLMIGFASSVLGCLLIFLIRNKHQVIKLGRPLVEICRESLAHKAEELNEQNQDSETSEIDADTPVSPSVENEQQPAAESKTEGEEDEDEGWITVTRNNSRSRRKRSREMLFAKKASSDTAINKSASSHSPAPRKPRSPKDSGFSFPTDRELMKKKDKDLRPRPLRKWKPTSKEELKMNVPWTPDLNPEGFDPEEMFKINEEQFGVKSSFDPRMSAYTCPVKYKDIQLDKLIRSRRKPARPASEQKPKRR